MGALQLCERHPPVVAPHPVRGRSGHRGRGAELAERRLQLGPERVRVHVGHSRDGEHSGRRVDLLQTAALLQLPRQRRREAGRKLRVAVDKLAEPLAVDLAAARCRERPAPTPSASCPSAPRVRRLRHQARVDAGLEARRRPPRGPATARTRAGRAGLRRRPRGRATPARGSAPFRRGTPARPADAVKASPGVTYRRAGRCLPSADSRTFGSASRCGNAAGAEARYERLRSISSIR